ncbi:hypothetical protein BGZ80_001052 [Entomortierella chlamydospora]|uniref:Uncharacterized protein n=1 Tax=Entomortierella chlamydospora TaxID=101097 RepID=A0A9P6MRR7_9FUNG|nr:hypothetical protein BGZ80_001052 [Entomortierella chlamydospora]
MVGVMRVKAPDAAHHHLVAYCIRLAAESMRLYILQQLSGQFGQLFYEISVVFPSRWDIPAAEEVTTVIGQVMAIRKELVSYNKLAIRKKATRQPRCRLSSSFPPSPHLPARQRTAPPV